MLKSHKSKASILSPKTRDPVTYLPSGAHTTVGGTTHTSMWMPEQDKKNKEMTAKIIND